jgi:uncharacterized protein (TIGR00251 family)
MTDHEKLSEAITAIPGGIIISVEVSAGSKREHFPAGCNEWRHTILCQTKAPPVGGRANRAVMDAVAEALHVSRSQVSILSGATSTQKRVEVLGVEAEEAVEILLREVNMD